MKGEQLVYVCPEDGCRFHAMEPGKCRSHPYPCRAMGPELVPLEVVPKDEAQEALSEKAREAEGLAENAISPAEAENLFAAYAGGSVDATLLDSVTLKLETIAGRELVP